MNNRTATQSGSRSTGRNQSTAPAMQGPSQVGFPPVLPVQYRKLIDGTRIVSIRTEWTAFGVSTVVVFKDGTTQELGSFLASEKEAKQARLGHELRNRYLQRAGRLPAELAQSTLPATFSSEDDANKWLASLDIEVQKIITMSNRDFRALPGAQNEA